MTRLIIAALVVLTIGWSGSADAKTTYIQCGRDTYKLEEPMIGEAKFYFLPSRAGPKLRVSEIDKEYIRYWYSELERDKKKRPHVINRVKGELIYSRPLEITGEISVECVVRDKPKF